MLTEPDAEGFFFADVSYFVGDDPRERLARDNEAAERYIDAIDRLGGSLDPAELRRLLHGSSGRDHATIKQLRALLARFGERAKAGRSFATAAALQTFRATISAAMFERITFDPQIMGGRACIRGMRIPVSAVVGQIAHGASIDDVMASYPDLDADDVREALEYAAWLTREEVYTG